MAGVVHAASECGRYTGIRSADDQRRNSAAGGGDGSPCLETGKRRGRCSTVPSAGASVGKTRGVTGKRRTGSNNGIKRYGERFGMYLNWS